MKRRAFGLMLAGTLAHRPLALAQVAATARIGWISIADHPFVKDFRQGMRERGFVEGRNLTLEYRYAEGQVERLPGLIAELVAARVDLIVASGSAAVLAASHGHATIPVVFVSADPNSFSVPLNFARPEGNLTGTALMYDVLVTKWVELMHELVPSAARFAVLVDGSAGDRQQLTTIIQAARRLSIDIAPVQAATPDEFRAAFTTATERQAGALIVVSSPFFAEQKHALIGLAAAYRLPAVYDQRDFVHSGGLLSFGPDLAKVFRDLADYVVRVLRGAPASTLPVIQPTKFVLSVNARTAKALDLALPPLLMSAADEIFE
jgi:putative ABC transport system substrate-binding protein